MLCVSSYEFEQLIIHYGHIINRFSMGIVLDPYEVV
jgi:hypothetical protein